MTGLTKLTLVAVLLTSSGCANLQGLDRNGTAIDRLKPDAAAHATALAGDDVALMRETGLTLLARLGAYAGW